MNGIGEARDQFLSAAEGIFVSSKDITLEEAKVKLRAAASEIDRKFGLENILQLSWGRGLPFLISIFSLLKTETCFLPLLSTLVHVGGNMLEGIAKLFLPRQKSRLRTNGTSRRKAKG